MKKATSKGCLCTPAGGRTLDTLIKSQVLYQLSYKRIFLLVQSACFRIASAKVLPFFETTKYFLNFFSLPPFFSSVFVSLPANSLHAGTRKSQSYEIVHFVQRPCTLCAEVLHTLCRSLAHFAQKPCTNSTLRYLETLVPS